MSTEAILAMLTDQIQNNVASGEMPNGEYDVVVKTCTADDGGKSVRLDCEVIAGLYKGRRLITFVGITLAAVQAGRVKALFDATGHTPADLRSFLTLHELALRGFIGKTMRVARVAKQDGQVTHNITGPITELRSGAPQA